MNSSHHAVTDAGRDPAASAGAATAPDHADHDLAPFFAALERTGEHIRTRAERIPLDELRQWRTDPASGALRHSSGKFYTIQGVAVSVFAPGGEQHWHQPIIAQPEIGILGVLVKRVDGVLHCLAQLKDEPGNINGLQVSPTVQATRSNYTRVHGGSRVPYLEWFQEHGRHAVVTDVRQSEQGSRFLHKRNRNMVVEAQGEVAEREGFHWLTVPQLHRLLRRDDLVNMDARSVLSCLPFPDLVGDLDGGDGEDLAACAVRSWRGDGETSRSATELLSWITELRTQTHVEVREAPLGGLPHWRFDGDTVSHEDGRFFDVIGVRVEARGREVAGWDQPMVAARQVGLAAFLVRRVDGALQVLVGIRAEPGFTDVLELGPTVQCSPADHASSGAPAPPFLDAVLGAAPARVRYDVTLSEEGGRFFRTRNRYLIVETAPGDTAADIGGRAEDHPGSPAAGPVGFRWVTLHQLTGLTRHSHYLSMEGRTLLAALATLTTTAEELPA
ncbi:NDP-hexose 2,3-dehydratase family protein [Streptomyces rubiginosohelvolus]|uniref:NDP-hexose 2,3-dehydratase family protein n=1 Tax=Streptomyces rubiginosohelvolus TaxID=67362 RepID=UPI0035D832B6